MKVLHVSTHINIGGIGQYIVSLTKALKAKGVDCMVATAGGDLEPELKKNGIRHICLDIKTKSELSPKVLRSIYSLSRIIKDEGVDIIHAHTRVSQVVSFFASRKTGVPYVSTCHGHFKRRLSRRLFDSWGKKVVAISDAVKIHLHKDLGVDEKRIELIYTGIDVERYSKEYSDGEIAEAKKKLGLKDGPVIGTMGRLSPVKGQRFLIEAIKYVILKGKGAQCLIIGSGKEEKALKDLAKKLGIERSVIFAGANFTDVPLYLSCMDVFVLPSIKEGLGMALLETMASGRPCVASETGGISNIITSGVNGLLVPVGDTKAIGDAIIRIIDDHVLRGKISLGGRWLVRERFSIDLMADEMIKFYKGVINEKRP